MDFGGATHFRGADKKNASVLPLIQPMIYIGEHRPLCCLFKRLI